MPRPFSREEEEHQADESTSGRQAQRLVPERETTMPIRKAWKTLRTPGLLFLPKLAGKTSKQFFKSLPSKRISDQLNPKFGIQWSSHQAVSD